MSSNPIHKKRHAHFGRIFSVLFLVTALLFACNRIADKKDTETVSLNTNSPSSADETLPQSIPITTQPDMASTTEAPTEATTEPIEIPESIMLEVPYISQKGLVPTGCEMISAKMVLEYYGKKATVNDLIDNMFCEYPTIIDGKNYAYSPYVAFIGTPWDESSFGCYPPVIVDMMNALLPEGKTAVDMTGTELQTLAETYLPRNTPVLVWATISMLETYHNIGWYLLDENGNPTDEWYDWKANEHCLVLVGYDSEYYYFNDPYEGRGLVSYERELVESRYADIGKCAVVVLDE